MGAPISPLAFGLHQDWLCPGSETSAVLDSGAHVTLGAVKLVAGRIFLRYGQLTTIPANEDHTMALRALEGRNAGLNLDTSAAGVDATSFNSTPVDA